MIRGAVAAALLMLPACGTQEPPADIAIEGAWARETVVGQSSAAAYLTIVNRGDGADRLVAASAPSAEAASLHSTSSSGGVARMRPIENGVSIPARGSAQFRPGGDHVMLTGLAEPLKAGSTAELRLRFERGGERRVELRIVSAASAGPSQDHGGH